MDAAYKMSVVNLKSESMLFIALSVLLLFPSNSQQNIKTEQSSTNVSESLANKTLIKPISFEAGEQTNQESYVPDATTEFPSLLDDTNRLFNLTKAHNLTKVLSDTHIYYNSSFIVDEIIAKSLWIDLDKEKDVKHSELLSNSHRRAATIKLKFAFPFYGHSVSKVTIATGGFLYTGEHVHSWLAATQYIAPLMANFDTSISTNSIIKYHDNGAAFTVQWENVTLQEKPKNGGFTFQATIFKSGHITFVYKNIPYPIKNITDDNHPVKIGISDAYINDRVVFFVRRKTIYEYHNVNFKQKKFSNWTAIKLTPLITCNYYTDCSSCVSAIIAFSCEWCPSLNRCSSGVDRNRQDWVEKNCTISSTKTVKQCSASRTANPLHPVITDSSTLHSWSEHEMAGKELTPLKIIHGSSKVHHVPSDVNTSLIFSFICSFVLVGSIICWIAYAYMNPHSASGQFLIRYRPSQWSLKRGVARYTAATIHI